jgi:hypothetical protein
MQENGDLWLKHKQKLHRPNIKNPKNMIFHAKNADSMDRCFYNVYCNV